MTKVHVLVFRSSLTNHHLWCLSLVDDRQVLAFSTFSNHHLSWVPLRFLFDPCKSVEVKKLLSQSRSYDLHLELERTNNLWCSKGLNFHQSPRCIMYIHQGLVCRIYPKHCHQFLYSPSSDASILSIQSGGPPVLSWILNPMNYSYFSIIKHSYLSYFSYQLSHLKSIKSNLNPNKPPLNSIKTDFLLVKYIHIVISWGPL